MSARWNAALAALTERAYGTIDADPQVLLEVAGGPVGQTADIYHARLFGFDDQVDDEMQLRRVEPIIYRPIAERLTITDLDPTDLRMSRRAEYVLQSSYARASLAAELAPPGVTHGPDFLVRVLFLRYRRDSKDS